MNIVSRFLNVSIAEEGERQRVLVEDSSTVTLPGLRVFEN